MCAEVARSSSSSTDEDQTTTPTQNRSQKTAYHTDPPMYIVSVSIDGDSPLFSFLTLGCFGSLEGVRERRFGHPVPA